VSRFAGPRGLTAAATGCVVAGVVVAITAGRAWLRFTVVEAPLPDIQATSNGHAVASATMPLALVVLAGAVALPATRRLGRRLTGVLLVLAGLGIVVSCVHVLAAPGSVAAVQAGRVAGRTGVRASMVSVAPWPWLALIGGVLAMLVGSVALRGSAGWPAMGRRFEAGRPDSPQAAAEASAVSMWDRLDHGDDPTV
jgi:uncharacterized membrane protein (TIGR02234 family)